MSKTPITDAEKSRYSRINIRMSKLSRTLRSKGSKNNWTEMAKMLFWGDNDNSRQQIMKLISTKRRSSKSKDTAHSYTTEQLQYLLVLMLILTIAEKKTQEAYEKDFSERCDAITKDHGLEENQYWPDNKVPAEWEKLAAEFEERSVQILQDTLREYSMNEIADQVQLGGANEFFNIISNIEVQFFKVLRQPQKGKKEKGDGGFGSIPEAMTNR